MTTFSEVFENLIPELRTTILKRVQQWKPKAGYRSVWEDFEEVITPLLIDALKKSRLKITDENITIPQTKSVYPDMKISYQGNLYAIDIKSGDTKIKQPWYDMGRMDTFEEKHLEKYQDEYYVTVRWEDKENPKFVNVYIEPMRWSVGIDANHKCILFRPYDGKIRPKSWEDFENGKVYWHSKEDFRKSFEIAKNYRRMYFIKEWYKEFDKEQRSEVIKELNKIDK